VVKATNALNSQKSSDPSAAVTPAGLPGKPSITGTTRGNQSVSVDWSSAATNGSAIVQYTVRASDGLHTCAVSTGPLSCTVNGLTNGTAYSFTVTATNGVGDGQASDASSSVTPAAVPGRPTNVTAVRGAASALVSWTAAGDNGSAITGHTVTASDGTHTCSWTSGPLTCTVLGLTNGTAYTFTVVSTNGVGSSLPSDSSDSVTPASAPGKPSSVTATRGNLDAQVSWLPASDNGSAVVQYVVTASDSIHGCVWTSGPLSCTVTALQNGSPYSFTVVAVNDLGPSASSDASNVVTPAAVPDAPSGVSATAGPTSASVAWSAPAANGSAITGYTVTSSPASAGCTTTGALSCTVSNLANLTAYTFQVTATNSVGTGLPSQPSTSVTIQDGATYHTITPTRVLDSRLSKGAPVFHSRVKQTVTIANGTTIPTDAVAVTGNVTVTGQSRNGYVTVAPSLVSGTEPPTSTINFPLGDTRANGITVPLAAGKLDFMYWSGSTADKAQVIFDVTGYFAR
jgi:hypothetical protein